MTSNTIKKKKLYIVSYGRYKRPDSDYADGFVEEYCEGVAIGAFSDKSIADAVATASELGCVSEVELDYISGHHRGVLDCMNPDLPGVKLAKKLYDRALKKIKQIEQEKNEIGGTI